MEKWNTNKGESPDLYNISNTFSTITVPANNFGYQNPHSGNGYAGGQFYGFGGITHCTSNNYFIEYIQVKLDTPLVSQEHYCTSFYVNHANRYNTAAISGIGLYFDTVHTYFSTECDLNYTPQIAETAYLSDDSAWVLVYGEYIAYGGERYIIIGNFHSESATDTTHLVSGLLPTYYQTYYYIDDVNVHCCTCDSTTSLHAGVVEVTKQSAYKLYPNPNSGNMTIEYAVKNADNAVFSIYAMDGRIVKQIALNINDTKINIDASQLNAGVYYYTVREGSKNAVTQKLVIVK